MSDLSHVASNPLLEYGAMTQGHAVVTCGPHTGHVFKTVLLCDTAETATLVVAGLAALAKLSGNRQHVAYYDDGAFHWMTGIKPRNCELYAAPIGGEA